MADTWEDYRTNTVWNPSADPTGASFVTAGSTEVAFVPGFEGFDNAAQYTFTGSPGAWAVRVRADYEADAWYRVTVLVLSSHPLTNLKLNIRPDIASGTDAGPGSEGFAVPAGVVTALDVSVQASAVAPGAAPGFVMVVPVEDAVTGQTVAVTGIMMIPALQIQSGPYFDGDTPGTVELRHAWLATPHASASVEQLRTPAPGTYSPWQVADRNEALNPRYLAGGGAPFFSVRFSWVGETLRMPYGGPDGIETARRFVCPAVQSGSNRGLDRWGNRDVGTPGTDDLWIGNPVTAGVPTGYGQWVRWTVAAEGPVTPLLTGRFHDGEGDWVGSTVEIARGEDSREWQWLYGVVVPPPGARYFCYRVHTVEVVDFGVGDSLDITGLLDKSRRTTFWDGWGPDTELSRHEWEGEADRSPSLYLTRERLTPRHAPTVSIGGAEIGCGDALTPGAPVIMEPLTIVWGRDGIYNPTEPSQLEAVIYDPTGAWGSDPALYGAEVLVTTDLGMLFRGTVDTVAMELLDLPPDDAWPTGQVWAVTLTAVDVIAALSKIVPPGYEPTNGDSFKNLETRYGPGYWHQDNTFDRRDELMRRANDYPAPVAGIAISVADLVPQTPPDQLWNIWWNEPTFSMGPDFYTLIRAVIARGDDMSHVDYHPEPHRLAYARWPTPGGLALTWTGDTIGIDGTTGTSVTVVPCWQVGIAGDGKVHAALANNITELEFEEYFGYYYMQQIRDDQVPPGDPGPFPIYGQIVVFDRTPESFPVAHQGGGAGRAVHASMIGANTSLAGSKNQRAADAAAKLAPQVAELNGLLTPPVLRFDLERENFGAQVEYEILRTWTPADAWAFPGAVYESLVGWPLMQQLIGGELRYERGWTIDAVFAPSRALPAGGLTIAELVTFDTPGFDDYADTITLATLGLVSEGINEGN